jgi:hypothetical protein
MKRVEASTAPKLHWAIVSGIHQLESTLAAFLTTPVTFADLLAANFEQRCATGFPFDTLDELMTEAKALQAAQGDDVVLSVDHGANQRTDYSVADLVANLENLHAMAAPLRAVGKKGRKAA